MGFGYGGRMKKAFIAALTLSTALSTASADSFGIRAGYLQPWYTYQGEALSLDGSFSVGLQYTYSLDALSSVRAALDLTPNLHGLDLMGFGGELAYLVKFPGAVSTYNDINLYAGAGLGAQFATDSGANLMAFNPTLIGGMNFYATPELGLYFEVGAGYSFMTVSGNGSSTTFGGLFAQPRLGLTYTLR